MNDNKKKAIIGAKIKLPLLKTLRECQEKKLIIYCTKDFRIGYPDFCSDQFFASFYIEFRNGTGWLIYSTNSIRNDRMCIQQWHAEHIKKICTNITKALVIVPNTILDNEKEYKEVIKYNEKIHQHHIKSFIDSIIIQDELEELILQNANNP